MPTAASPARRTARSTAVPGPRSGGIDIDPVNNEIAPMAASRKTKGSDVNANALTTATLSFPSFHGLLEDHIPATIRMIAKTRAIRG